MNPPQWSVLHANGRLTKKSAFWKRVVSSPPVAYHDCPEQLTIFTINDQRPGCLERQGLPITNLMAWLPNQRAVPMKLRGLLTAANRCSTPYLLYVDAIDVLLFGSTSRILDQFKSFNCQMLFGAECNHWPAACPTRDWEAAHATPPACWLNAGCVVASCAWVAAHFPVDTDCEEDQGWWKQRYREHWPDIRIDDGCRIFMNLYGRTDAETLLP